MEERIKIDNRIKMSYDEFFFYLFYGILLFVKGIGLYEGMLLFNIAIVAALICYAIKLLFTEYSLLEWIIFVAIIICAFVAYRTTGEKAVIITFLIVMGMKSIPLERMLKLTFYIWTVTFWGTFVFNLLFSNHEIMLMHNKFGLGFVPRHSMGFPHPNVLHLSFMIWVMLYLYFDSQTGKRRIETIITVSALNVFIFLFSLSITGAGLTFAFIALFEGIIFCTNRKILSAYKRISYVVLPICIFACTVPPLCFQGKLYDIANILLNTRLKIWNYYLTTFTPKLFGTTVCSPFYGTLSLDCSYLYLLYYYGIVLSLFLVALFELVVVSNVRHNKNKELIIILCCLFAGIVEPFLFNFSMKNILLLFAGVELFSLLEKIPIIKPLKSVVSNKACLKIKSICLHKRGSICYKKAYLVGGGVGIVLGMLYYLICRVPESILLEQSRCDFIPLDKAITDETTGILYYSFSGAPLIWNKILWTIGFLLLGFVVGMGIEMIWSYIHESRADRA